MKRMRRCNVINIDMILSEEQLNAINKFSSGENLFITGQAGVGKSALIDGIVAQALVEKKTVQVCAMTGCAAILLKNAKTIHSWSGIRLGNEPVDTIIGRIFRMSRNRNAWNDTDVLIIDEISMMSMAMFEMLNEIGINVRRACPKHYESGNNVFGGIQLIFCGDPFQLPPVATVNIENSSKFCFESPLWDQVFKKENHIELTTVYRQIDPLYRSILSNIRRGIVIPEHVKILKERIMPVDVDKHNGCVPPKLYPIRSKVDDYNNRKFDALSTPEFSYTWIQMTNCPTNMSTLKPNTAEDIEKFQLLSTQQQDSELNAMISTLPCTNLLRIKTGAKNEYIRNKRSCS